MVWIFRIVWMLRMVWIRDGSSTSAMYLSTSTSTFNFAKYKYKYKYFCLKFWQVQVQVLWANFKYKYSSTFQKYQVQVQVLCAKFKYNYSSTLSKRCNTKCEYRQTCLNRPSTGQLITAGLDRWPVYSNSKADVDTQNPNRSNVRVIKAQENGNQCDKRVIQLEYHACVIYVQHILLF